jgi:carbonic anhydrase/acetyltransferase-like protein (isoleucine patch superfamily)
VPLYSFEGVSPVVHESAWIAPTATLIGAVTVEADASIWYGAVLRADFGQIVVRAGANVQDGSVVHGGGEGVEIGRGATIGHLCVIHGCTIGAEAVVGNGATVQDGAVVGARCMVAAGALVPPGMVTEPERLVIGAPAKIRGPLSDGARWWVDNNPQIYRELAARHRAGVIPVDA